MIEVFAILYDETTPVATSWLALGVQVAIILSIPVGYKLASSYYE